MARTIQTARKSVPPPLPTKYRLLSRRISSPRSITETVSHDKFDRKTQPFRFLDLFLEIRLQIYRHCSAYPDAEGDDDEDEGDEHDTSTTYIPNVVRAEWDVTTKTRLSLLSVCRQINAEFSPIYYRTCDFLVNTQRKPIPAYAPWLTDPTDQETMITRHTAEDFQRDFLSILKPTQFSHIRHLNYDASIWDKFVWLPRKFTPTRSLLNWFDDVSVMPTNVDFHGLLQLGTALTQFKDQLTALEMVTLSSRGDPDNVIYRLSEEEARDSGAVWKVASESGRWEEVQRAFNPDRATRRPKALQGWEITRRVLIRWKESYLSRGARRDFANDKPLYVRRVVLSFQKPATQQQALGGSGLAEPEPHPLNTVIDTEDDQQVYGGPDNFDSDHEDY